MTFDTPTFLHAASAPPRRYAPCLGQECPRSFVPRPPNNEQIQRQWTTSRTRSKVIASGADGVAVHGVIGTDARGPKGTVLHVRARDPQKCFPPIRNPTPEPGTPQRSGPSPDFKNAGRSRTPGRPRRAGFTHPIRDRAPWRRVHLRSGRSRYNALVNGNVYGVSWIDLLGCERLRRGKLISLRLCSAKSPVTSRESSTYPTSHPWPCPHSSPPSSPLPPRGCSSRAPGAMLDWQRRTRPSPRAGTR